MSEDSHARASCLSGSKLRDYSGNKVGQTRRNVLSRDPLRKIGQIRKPAGIILPFDFISSVVLRKFCRLADHQWRNHRPRGRGGLKSIGGEAEVVRDFAKAVEADASLETKAKFPK